MSENQVKNFSIIRTLQRELTRYGLNPRDWLVLSREDIQTNSVILTNRDDVDFRLIGAIKLEPSSAATWAQLSVLSL